MPSRSRSSYDRSSSSDLGFSTVMRSEEAFGARRENAAAIASAHASGVRKHGTPAFVSASSASGASGTRKAASGLAALRESMMGRTASSGWKRAEEPTTATTR